MIFYMVELMAETERSGLFAVLRTSSVLEGRVEAKAKLEG